jgi:transposase InsO family protein
VHVPSRVYNRVQDRAVLESFFSTLRRELIHHTTYKPHEDATQFAERSEALCGQKSYPQAGGLLLGRLSHARRR